MVKLTPQLTARRKHTMPQDGSKIPPVFIRISGVKVFLHPCHYNLHSFPPLLPLFHYPSAFPPKFFPSPQLSPHAFSTSRAGISSLRLPCFRSDNSLFFFSFSASFAFFFSLKHAQVYYKTKLMKTKLNVPEFHFFSYYFHWNGKYLSQI